MQVLLAANKFRRSRRRTPRKGPAVEYTKPLVRQRAKNKMKNAMAKLRANRVNAKAAEGMFARQRGTMKRRAAAARDADEDEMPRRPPRSHRESLMRLYQKHAPDKVGNVGKILEKFENDHEKMYNLLQGLYPDANIERYQG